MILIGGAGDSLPGFILLYNYIELNGSQKVVPVAEKSSHVLPRLPGLRKDQARGKGRFLHQTLYRVKHNH